MENFFQYKKTGTINVKSVKGRALIREMKCDALLSEIKPVLDYFKLEEGATFENKEQEETFESEKKTWEELYAVVEDQCKALSKYKKGNNTNLSKVDLGYLENVKGWVNKWKQTNVSEEEPGNVLNNSRSVASEVKRMNFRKSRKNSRSLRKSRKNRRNTRRH